MGKGPSRVKHFDSTAMVFERIVRCPRCGIKLAEAQGNARVYGLLIKCRRCSLPVRIEL